jgi:hypothetical protein
MKPSLTRLKLEKLSKFTHNVARMLEKILL